VFNFQEEQRRRGIGLKAIIAIACRGTGATPLQVTNPYQMP
jgi:hypothetical protein